MNKKQNNIKSIKYRQIIETGTKLFIRHGIKRITVEEICEEAGVSKMTFYKFFANKLELVKQIVTGMMDEGFKFVDNIMAQDIPYEEKVRQNIKHKIEGIRKYGDLFFEEFLRIPELQPYIAEMNSNAVKKIIEIFNTGKAEGAIREDITPEFYQYLLGHLSIMGNDDNLKKVFPDMGHRIETLIDVLFHGVFKTPSN
ncbi:MAG: TetR/AcrR family transcriptional regulator [Spirochaetes bacterium]|nr:TetR/AcrR family transcriptional regulator [Spirochaetota bacterium]